jgi:small-conductance mechanosensitive channel
VGAPFNYIIPLIVFNTLLPLAELPASVYNLVSKIISITLTFLFAWALIRFINVMQEFVIHRYDIQKADNLRERKIRTQLQFIRRLMVGVIVFVAIAMVLLSFNTMRRIGTGLLTGVGIGGIIVGFAAQRSLGNLLAGFQIAFTQPIRIDDAVIVENEFGMVEEITLTYVVVRLWDERRMVLPINYFIEKPFQNWTRTSSALLGTVLLYTDYTVPVDAVRAELTRLLTGNKLWDGRVNAVQVTNVSERTVELRALVSGRNSGEVFDLRCYVREKLVDFIKKNYADAFPKERAVFEGGNLVANV